MSLGKKLKKVAKAAVRSTAAVVTGGASEAALYGAKKYVDSREDTAATQAAEAQQQADLESYFGYSSLADLTKARRKKEEELGALGQKTTGLSSLIGKGTTLG